MNNKELKNISVPRELFREMFKASQRWEELNNEFEDFLLGSNEEFVEKIKRARKEHLEGKTRNLETLKQELI